MQFLPEQPESRRGFFRAAARYGALTLVGVIAGVAAQPRRLQGQECINRGLCGNCGLFTTCGLPQALSAKRAREKG